jgi:hypothetical protein
MARFSLIGGSYQSQSPVADAEELINWYPETLEENGTSSAALYPSPGLSVFSTITLPVRGIFQINYPGAPSNGRVFAVGGPTFYEILSNGIPNAIGTIPTDGLPVSMAANPLQLAVCSAGVVFIYTFASNTFAVVPVTNFSAGGVTTPVSKIDYSDGFFVAMLSNCNTWQVSAPFDGTTWPGLATSGVMSVYPENNVGMIVDHRYVWLFGTKKSQVYVDAGAPIFPYQVIPGALIECGCASRDSVAKLDNSIFLLGQDERGSGMVWRTSGYSLVRVSNFAVEYAIQSYIAKGQPVNNAVGWGVQDQGHTFYYLYFPNSNITWVYDVATQLWHKRLFWNGATYGAHLAQCHAYGFGQHLVGDWSSGNIYNQSIASLTDNGSLIRRERIAPAISTERQWIHHHQLQIDLETGLGPQPPLLDGDGNPRDPQLMLSWSDDGGHSYGNEYILNCGQAGAYRRRAIQWRLGRSRGRNYKIVATDPIPWRIVDGYVQATGFNVPAERIVKSYGKVA